MAGEIAKTDGVCLAIHPWSRTSHVVWWLTPAGKVATVVKGAVRPKSAFLGQYDLNYTCEVLYYVRERGGLHALRECSPRDLRERLRTDYRALALADYLRWLSAEFAPTGPDCAAWYALLESSLPRGPLAGPEDALSRLLTFETKVLRLLGLAPEVEAESGAFALRGERKIPVSREVADCIRRPDVAKNLQVLLDAVRAIGVFYQFHLDCALDVRRTVLGMISRKQES